MKIASLKMMRPILLWLLCLSFPIAAAEASTANSPITAQVVNDHLSLINRAAERYRIMSVLEKKMDDQQLLEKARDKLLSVSDIQLQLMASLSDRIAAENNTAGADIAFLLITALLILS